MLNNFNFEQDVIQFLLKTPKCSKYINKNKTLDELLFIFFESLLGMITPIKRTVVITKALKNNPLFLKYKNIINDISILFKNGNTKINQYLSNKSGNRDFLLRDMNIYHLHLGSKGKRTDDLLCVMIQDNIVYFIDISNHRGLFIKQHELQNNEVCSSIWEEWMRLFNILCLEYPNITNEYFLKGVISAQSLKSYDYIKLLRNGCNVIFNNQDKYYSLPGGTATSGQSIKVVNQVNIFFHSLDRLKSIIHNNSKWQKMKLYLKVEDEFLTKISIRERLSQEIILSNY